MKRGFGFALVVALLGLGACKTPVADYCEQSSDCTDLGKPFCDVNGDYDESDHIARTCIPFPDDATKDFCLDDDRDCPTSAPICGADRVCRGCTASAECGDSAPYCDVDSATCLVCEPSAFHRCDGPDLVVCNASGTGEDVTTCSTTCDATAMRCDDCTPGAFLGCTDASTASICSSTGVPTDTECAHACNATDMRCEQCEPSTTQCDPDIGSTGANVTCDSVGQVSATESCYVTCFGMPGETPLCVDLAPANGLTSYLDMTETAADVVITGNQTIDTSTGAVSGTSITNFLTSLVNGNLVRVYVVKSLTQSGTLRVIGQHPIAIVSHGDVTIRGHINVSASGSARAAGSRDGSDGSACVGNEGGGDPAVPQDGTGGGGGGSFGGAGAAGGASTFGGFSGGPAGTAEGVAIGTFEPLRGGCRGGGIASDGTTNWGGAGGGAIQISTRAAIIFGETGFVTASGGGGNSSDGSQNVAGGGGSGGTILLEAPTIQAENAGGGIFANGGGGGCVDSTGVAFAGSDPGLDGNGGGGAIVCGPDGGDGASDLAGTLSPATAGVAGTTSDAPSGGGGGGGLGAIGVRGTYQGTGTILTSPSILEMPLNVRIQ